METRFLDSFVMVADCGSMAEAARRLNLTPTALAQRIRVLEHEFGMPLVTRSGRFVRLTEAGARVLERARHFQRELHKLKEVASTEDFSGDLRLGVIRSSLSNIAPELLKNAVAHHPRLSVFIEIGTSQDLYHQLAAGKLDAALLVAPPFRIPKSLAWRALRDEPLVVLAPSSLAGANALEILETHPLVRYDRRGWGGFLTDQYLQEHGLHPTERFELDSLEGILTLIGMGLGVSLVPDWIQPGALPQGVTALRLPGTPPARRLGILWPARSPYARLFEQILPLQTDQHT
ncbi:MAG TPA: LysR family transcriptional regulator [Eoetvoesiella sp.]